MVKLKQTTSKSLSEPNSPSKSSVWFKLTKPTVVKLLYTGYPFTFTIGYD